jgi:hypothetical protein
MRLLNLIVIAALVVAAAWVYKIKFDSTVQAERVERLRADIRRERDSTAALRAEWSKLDNPARVQRLSDRYLKFKPIDLAQFDALDRLPERPAPPMPPAMDDPIAKMLESDEATASLPDAR